MGMPGLQRSIIKGLTVSALLVGLGGCLADEGQQQQAKQDVVRPAKIIKVSSGAGPKLKTFPGITEASEKSELAFRVSGQIAELPVRAGQALKKGDLIARLDDASYQNVLADRKANYDLTRIELERRKKLQQKNHVSKSTLDIARTNFESARAALKQAQDDLRYTRLLAPYDGMVSRTLVENFENIQAKQTVVLFQGNDNIDISFNVPEDLLLRMNSETTRGQVLVRFDSIPDRTFNAFYKEHETLPDQATRSFRVVVTMPMPIGITALPGMSVNVVVDTSEIIDRKVATVKVPVEAVFEAEGETWVWQLKPDNTVFKTHVEVDRIDGDSILLANGLIEGTRIIAAGVSHIRDGQTVREMSKERGL
ncbi:MAG: efflux RND transporter periplasmic adaptor subunit [Sneathiella sp.]|nr:efflux RND transporter periplasmic adaptor subunit [Sneathiella sp.]